MKATKRAAAARPHKPAIAKKAEATNAAGFDIDTVMSIVCNNLERPVAQILAVLRAELGVDLNREQPYEILRRAAKERRLHYIAPLDSELSVRLLEGHEWLRRARVVRTSSAADVARHAALLLREFAEAWDQPDLHMGVAGGGLMAETIHYWSDFLRESGRLKLKRLFIHALVAATDDPRRSPNGFVQWLLDDALPFKTELIGLPAPAFLSPSSFASLREMEGIRDAFEQARDLDIVITSAGAHWDRGCSGLNNKYRDVSPESVRTLEDAGCIGDIIWQPFGPGGPVVGEVNKRTVTLLDLVEVPKMVSAGMRVMLVLAPCRGAGCGQPKGDILRALLGWRNGVTDLVTDARAAALAVSR